MIKTATDFAKAVGVNIPYAQIKNNVSENLKMNLPEAQPYRQNDLEAMLLGGGPSLGEFEGDIREKREAGMPLITTNGAYNWCVEHGIKPSMQIVVDGREFNKRFVVPHVEGCHYMLASQCHPDIIKAAPREQTILWHAGCSDAVTEALEEYDNGRGKGRQWFPVMGGSTVMMRAIPMLIMLGYHKFHIYGLDSCVMDGKHHSYEQKENDKKATIKVRLGGREFECQLWMWVQAKEFIDMQKMIADHCDMAVYGDGLIAHIIKTAAREYENGRKRLHDIQQREAVSG